MNTTEYHICMLGPTRCGKTTLLASLIREFDTVVARAQRENFITFPNPGRKVLDVIRDMFGGDTARHPFMSLTASGTTEGKINDRINSIQIGIETHSFRTGTLEGTQEHEEFILDLDYNVRVRFVDPMIRLILHDFPGGWIQQKDRLNEVRFDQAEIMILPIDAPLLMEPKTDREREIAYRQLSEKEIHTVIGTWAESRRHDNRGLFILAPVKCESYFTDHNTSHYFRDRSEELRQKVLERYKPHIDILHADCPGVQCLYMPIDTIGSCYIARKHWIYDEPEPGLELTYSFPADPNCSPGWTPFGPVEIMFTILDYITMNEQIARDQNWKNWILNTVMAETNFIEGLKAIREGVEAYRTGRSLPHYERTLKL